MMQVEPGVYSVLLDGASFEFRIPRSASEGMVAAAQNRSFAVEVRDPRDAARGSRSALGSGRQNVTAPMPGKVVRVLVKEDEHVESSQGLVVVEAMKMQNELKASRPGRVIEVRAREGDTSRRRDLVVLE